MSVLDVCVFVHVSMCMCGVCGVYLYMYACIVCHDMFWCLEYLMSSFNALITQWMTLGFYMACINK